MNRGGSDDDTVHTNFPSRSHIRQRTDAATELEPGGHRCPNAPDHLSVSLHTLPGAVQIDDMDPFRTEALPAPGGIHGVGIELGFPIEVTLDESNSLAATDVDGGVDDHPLHRFTKWSAPLVAKAITVSIQPNG